VLHEYLGEIVEVANYFVGGYVFFCKPVFKQNILYEKRGALMVVKKFNMFA